MKKVCQNTSCPYADTQHYPDVGIAGLESLIAERDRLYQERHIANQQAVANALEAVGKQTKLSLEYQAETTRKAEMLQAEYNKTHNDLIRRTDSLVGDMIPRKELDLIISDFRREHKRLEDTLLAHNETDTAFHMESRSMFMPRAEFDRLHSDLMSRVEAERIDVARQIQDLREFKSAEVARSSTVLTERTQQNWTLGQLIAVSVAVGGWVITAIALIIHYTIK